MRIIERIEISKFRSIGDSETFTTNDLNIFSGGNDSGKSNVLKALNLFFNNETDFRSRYFSDTDFNKWYRDNNIRGQRVIEISVWFSKGNYRDKMGINNGFKAKKVYNVDGGVDTLFYDVEGNEIAQISSSYKRANAVISEKIEFIYIPAVRDSKFRESIQRLIELIAQSSDKRFKSQDLKESFENMENGIEGQLSDLKRFVLDHMKIKFETNVNFGTLLESLSFETNERIKIRKKGRKDPEIQSVSLRQRGDGIQMQFISFLLWFISKNDKKHFYVWGYEEPEIAFEFQRQFELVDLFKKLYSKVAQIFITTHSPAFAFIKSDDGTKVFRVSYEQDKRTRKERLLSKIYPIEDYMEGLFSNYADTDGQEEKKSLERDIWGVNIQKISQMLGQSMNDVIGYRHITDDEIGHLMRSLKNLKEENTDLTRKVKDVETKLESTYPNKIFICEDKKAIRLWKHLLFEKLDISEDSIQIFSSKGCSKDDVEIAIKHLQSKRSSYRPRIFRQLDRDGYTQVQIDFLEQRKNEKFNCFGGYRVKFNPFNEIENFAIPLDDFFTIDKLKEFEVYNKITDAFNQTLKSSINNALKLCKTDSERNLFNGQEAVMIQEARSNLLKYFPGKEIIKTKHNFRPLQKIKQANQEELPPELWTYLEEVKTFFHN